MYQPDSYGPWCHTYGDDEEHVVRDGRVFAEVGSAIHRHGDFLLQHHADVPVPGTGLKSPLKRTGCFTIRGLLTMWSFSHGAFTGACGQCRGEIRAFRCGSGMSIASSGATGYCLRCGRYARRHILFRPLLRYLTIDVIKSAAEQDHPHLPPPPLRNPEPQPLDEFGLPIEDPTRAAESHRRADWAAERARLAWKPLRDALGEVGEALKL